SPPSTARRSGAAGSRAERAAGRERGAAAPRVGAAHVTCESPCSWSQVDQNRLYSGHMATSSAEIHVAVDLTVLTLREGALNVLLIQREDEPHRGAWALPGGFVQLGEDLGAAAYRVPSDEASLGSGAVHLEQVRTFGTPGRDPRGHVVSVVFMALGADLPDPRRGEDVADARWWALADLADVTLAFDHATVLDSAVERA